MSFKRSALFAVALAAGCRDHHDRPRLAQQPVEPGTPVPPSGPEAPPPPDATEVEIVVHARQDTVDAAVPPESGVPLFINPGAAPGTPGNGAPGSGGD